MIIGSLRILTCLLFSSLWAAPNFAQIQPLPQQPTYGAKKTEPQGPRAIGVLAWTAKGPRLIPITIKINNEFYDASLYRAQPVPMAVDSGVVYEVQKAGEPLGDFTLSEAEQTGNGLWVGVGNFDSKEAQDKRKEKATRRAAAAAAAKAAEEKAEEGDRPVLKRPAPKQSPPETETPKPSAPPTDSPQAQQPSSTSESSPAPATQSKPQLTETERDPSRPILRRGKPEQEQATALGKEKEPEAKKLAPPPPGLAKLEVAVSDDSPKEMHPYKWTWKDAAEEQKLKEQAEKLAQAILANYATKTGGPKPGELQDVDFQTYDLTYSNAATVILSARVVPGAKAVVTRRGAKTTKAPEPASPENGFEYYITLVGREDIYGQMQKEFVVATDSKHLDAFPKMKLVDIVDADGKGAGGFLFQSTSDRGDSFVIYRDLGWSLQEVIRVPEPKV